jgi:dTDP-4-dehydrorhamnose reductase
MDSQKLRAAQLMKTILLGRNGQVGWELRRALLPLGEVVAPDRQQADCLHPDTLRSLIRDQRPDVIVNAAAYTAVDKAETEPEAAAEVNTEAVGVLAEEANRLGAWLVHYSTDYVFDGLKTTRYVETDATKPLSVYGKTKLNGERLILERHPNRCLIFRTSWVYSARGGNFAKTILRLAKERNALKIVADQRGAPTSAELIADITALVLYRVIHAGTDADALSGIYHLAAAGDTTWYDYAVQVLAFAQERGVNLKVLPEAVDPIPTEAYPVPAPRPRNSLLNTDRLSTVFNLHLPHWRISVERLIDEIAAQGAL